MVATAAVSGCHYIEYQLGLLFIERPQYLSLPDNPYDPSIDWGAIRARDITPSREHWALCTTESLENKGSEQGHPSNTTCSP